MAIREYIGARYVPRFVGTYDPTTIYEALDVVDNGAGTSYIARKMVPAGTPLTDTTYWFIYGAASGAIVQLQNDVSALQLDMSDAQADILSNQNNINLLARNASKQDIVVVFGDSWADEVHDPTTVQLNKVLRENMNATVHNYSYGGTGFDVPNGYDEQLTWFAADLAADAYKLENIKCIILVCGLNDHYGGATSATFRARLQDWSDKLEAIIGNYNIPAYWVQNYSIENDYTQTNMTTLSRQVIYYHEVNIGLTSRLRYIPSFGLVSSWKSDGRHPNANGNRDWAMNIVRIINGVAPTMYKYQRITATINDAGLTGTDPLINMDYFVDYGARIVRSYMDISAHALYALSASPTSVTYDNKPPVDLANRVLADGKFMADNNYIGFNIYQAIPPTWSHLSGRYYLEVANTWPSI